MTRDARKIIRDLLLALVMVCVAVLLITRFLAVPWVVSGDSMEPALRAGDRVLVDLWSYRRRAPRPGEIALLRGPRELPLVKRVAGAAPDAPPGRIPPARPDEERFTVLGDNPGDSLDSRSFGPVPRHRFRGRVVWRYWPLSRSGSIR